MASTAYPWKSTRVPRSVAVLGGGITGLTAAHRLVQKGHRVRLFEQGPRAGGVIRSEACDGWIIESGPNSFQATTKEAAALINELGLARSVVEASPTAHNRYVVKDGQLLPLPLSPRKFFSSPFFSTKAKARIIADFALLPIRRRADVSVAKFFRAHFGQEFVDYAAQPFVSGIYAGDPEKLSAKHAFPKLWKLERRYGSLLRGQIALRRQNRDGGGGEKTISFTRGLQALTDALQSRLPAGTICLHARAEALFPGERWQVLWQEGQNVQTEMFDTVISALPAPALARLAISPQGNRPLASLDGIVHPPLVSLFLGFRREQVKHPLDGFGVLVPAAERRTVLGILFSSSLFPGRAPDGHVALTVMIGGALQPELAARPPEELWQTVRKDLAELLGISGEPVFRRHTFWPRAIAQYHLGYDRHLEAIAACERAYPRFFVGGNLRDGIALAQNIAAGEKIGVAGHGAVVRRRGWLARASNVQPPAPRFGHPLDSPFYQRSLPLLFL